MNKGNVLNGAYLVNGLRTPIGSLSGALSTCRTDDMAALVLRDLLKINPSIDPGCIDEVIFGCANQSGEDNRNVARMALLLAGLPFSIPAETVNRLCASGLSAAMASARSIMTGDADIAIAGGVENMTRGPWVISKAGSAFGRDQQMFDTSFGWRFINPLMKSMYGVDAMGETAENLAEKYNISREDQDLFAFRSQQKAVTALKSGRLAQEIIKVEIPQRKGPPVIFAEDEFVKAGTTTTGLAGLKPAFRTNGTVTAGNSSGLNDGAAALLLASETGLKKHNLKPIARIVSMGASGVEPRYMGIGPVEASRKALTKAGLSLDQMDIIELNEAFAAQVLSCTRELQIDDNDPRLNPNGGAIALGHPLGMSGARILLTAAKELQLRNKKYALVTMCIGVGQGYAVVIENY